MPSPRRSSKPRPEFDCAWASAGEIATAVAKGRVTAAAVVEDALARITARDPVLNAFTDVLAEPLDEPPVMRFTSWGLCALPSCTFSPVKS